MRVEDLKKEINQIPNSIKQRRMNQTRSIIEKRRASNLLGRSAAIFFNSIFFGCVHCHKYSPFGKRADTLIAAVVGVEARMEAGNDVIFCLVCTRAVALFTSILRPSTIVPFSSSRALSASSELANVTKPKPFDPRSLKIISTSSI